MKGELPGRMRVRRKEDAVRTGKSGVALGVPPCRQSRRRRGVTRREAGKDQGGRERARQVDRQIDRARERVCRDGVVREGRAR